MDPAIVVEAAQALGATNVRIMPGGGQKAVALADAPNGPTILKIVELAPPYAAVALERARREVAVLRLISNPNVVALESDLVELGRNPPTAVCWREEYLDGDDLDSRMGVHHSWSETAHVISRLAAGLAAFHEAGVVHRDLSPRNVRCLATGDIKLMDPGIARLLAKTTITGPMDPGSPGYMSPEHVSPAARPSYASDVFGLGILAFEMLTGTTPIPFVGDRSDYVRRLRDEQAPSVGTLRPDLTPAQIDFVDSCLKRQLARRFLDTAEVLDALAAL